MSKILRRAIFCLLVAPMLVAQQMTPALVARNLPFFERVLTDLSRSSGTQSQAHIDHFGLSQSEGQIVAALAAQFKTQEDILLNQASALAVQHTQSAASQLNQVRIQRRQLIIQTVNQLLQQLGSNGVSRLIDAMAKADAAAPRRVRPH